MPKRECDESRKNRLRRDMVETPKSYWQNGNQQRISEQENAQRPSHRFVRTIGVGLNA